MWGHREKTAVNKPQREAPDGTGPACSWLPGLHSAKPGDNRCLSWKPQCVVLRYRSSGNTGAESDHLCPCVSSLSVSKPQAQHIAPPAGSHCGAPVARQQRVEGGLCS